MPGRQMNDLSSGKHCLLDFLSPCLGPRTLEGLFEMTQYPFLSSSIASLPTGKQGQVSCGVAARLECARTPSRTTAVNRDDETLQLMKKITFWQLSLIGKSQQKGIELVIRPDASSANVAKPSKSQERSSWAWIKLTSSTFKKHALPIRMSLLTCHTSAQNASKGWGPKEHWTSISDKNTLKNAMSATSATWSIQTKCSTNVTLSNAMARSKKSWKNQFARSVRKSSQANKDFKDSGLTASIAHPLKKGKKQWWKV